MTAHLLVLTVGPVQQFIAAARRTRDLWFGSYLLSEISKAAAKAVMDEVGINALIFPAPATDADLDRDSPLNVANVVLSELGEVDPAAVARRAKEAAHSCWRSFADPVFRECEDLIRSDIWYDQVDDVIEFYAAWRPHASQTYQTDRAALMRLLSARKRCRNFLPARGRAGIPKSSLDGLRESVLRPPREWPGWSRRRLRLAEGEQLDVVGLVKRVWKPASGPVRYPSVARVAADPWLCKVSNSPHFNEFFQACRVRSDVVHEIDTSGPWGNPHYALFPFEGSAVYRSRYREFCREAEVSDSDLKPLAQALEKLTDDFGEPSSYLGVLVADGDHIGEALSKLQSPGDHKRFSQALASFAAKANDIVKTHNGVLVYSGGDDVLAFVPLDHCLECARSLHDTFGEMLADWATKPGSDLTLSVGLTIAHFMEPLEDLLRYGRAAEQHAKHPRSANSGQQDRNGLAVHLVKRGGGELAVRGNWSVDPDKHLTHLAELLRAEAISSRVAYDMHNIARLYDSWPEAIVKDAIQRDTLSVMQGKRPRGSSRMDEINGLIRERVQGADSLRSLANDLLVAKALGEGMGSR